MSTQRSRSDGTQGVNEPDAVSSAIGQPVEHVQYQANLFAKQVLACTLCLCSESALGAISDDRYRAQRRRRDRSTAG
jgi:hypothetical protein